MIDVEVRNFQSIEHASIRVDGFTALVGRSNIGKSALVRAVKAALTGAGGTSFVRHSSTCAKTVKKAKTCECHTTVTLKAKAFDLKWEKGDKVNRYTFNGQVYDRAETGTPEFLLRPGLDLDFDTVDVARKGKLLQVADQFDNVFLLDQTGSVVADVLSDVARLDRVNTAMRLVEKDRRDASSARKVYEKEVTELSARAAGYDGLDGAVGLVAGVGEALNRISERQAQILQLSGFAQELTSISVRVDDLESKTQISIPESTLLTEKCQLVTKLSSFCAQASEKAQVIRSLSGVEQVAVPEEEALLDRRAAVERLVLWVQKLQAFKELLGKVNQIEALRVPELPSFNEKREALALLNSFCTKYATVEGKTRELEQVYAQAETEESGLQAELSEENDSLKKALGVLGYCPTCTQPYTNEHSHKVEDASPVLSVSH